MVPHQPCSFCLQMNILWSGRLVQRLGTGLDALPLLCQSPHGWPNVLRPSCSGACAALSMQLREEHLPRQDYMLSMCPEFKTSLSAPLQVTLSMSLRRALSQYSMTPSGSWHASARDPALGSWPCCARTRGPPACGRSPTRWCWPATATTSSRSWATWPTSATCGALRPCARWRRMQRGRGRSPAALLARA